MIYLLTAMIGIASWYGPGFEGKPTASGEFFDPSAFTAASWHHPFDTILEVRNPANDQTVLDRVNDRGPAKDLNRIIDLSEAAFNRIADLETGLIQVEIKVAENPKPIETTRRNPKRRERNSSKNPEKSSKKPLRETLSK